MIYPSKRNKHCFHHELKILIRKRSHCYKRWCKTTNINYKLLYNGLRNTIQRKIKYWKPNKQCNYRLNRILMENRPYLRFVRYLKIFFCFENNSVLMKY